MQIPFDYVEGYEVARTLDPGLASNDISHITIGGPEANDVVEHLSTLGSEESMLLIPSWMNGDESALRNDPS